MQFSINDGPLAGKEGKLLTARQEGASRQQANQALAQLSEATRKDARLLRQIVFAHICSGCSSLQEMLRKNCTVAMAGQTHAIYTEGGQHNVGTARLG